MSTPRATYQTLYEEFAKILRTYGLDIKLSTHLEDVLFRSAQVPDDCTLEMGMWAPYGSEVESSSKKLDDTYCKFIFVISSFFSAKDFVAGLKKTFPEIDATDIAETIDEKEKKYKDRPVIIIKIRVDHLIHSIFPLVKEMLDKRPTRFSYRETWEAIQYDFMYQGVDTEKNNHFEKIWHALIFENLRRAQSLLGLSSLPFVLLDMISQYLGINLSSFSNRMSHAQKEGKESLTLTGIKSFLEKEDESHKKISAIHSLSGEEEVVKPEYTLVLFAEASKDILDQMSQFVSLFDPFDYVHTVYEGVITYDGQEYTHFVEIPNYILMHSGFRSDMLDALKNSPALKEYQKESGTEFIFTKCASTLKTLCHSLAGSEGECKQVGTLKALTQTLITMLEQKPYDFSKIEAAVAVVRAEQALFEKSVKGKTPTLFSSISALGQTQVGHFQDIFSKLTSLLNKAASSHEVKEDGQKKLCGR